MQKKNSCSWHGNFTEIVFQNGGKKSRTVDETWPIHFTFSRAFNLYYLLIKWEALPPLRAPSIDRLGILYGEFFLTVCVEKHKCAFQVINHAKDRMVFSGKFPKDINFAVFEEFTQQQIRQQQPLVVENMAKTLRMWWEKCMVSNICSQELGNIAKK